MGISICVIAGNESAHIERMLASFAPAFDELSLTIATGAVEPDDTAERAAIWCSEHGKAFVGSTYANARGCRWEHVDDFAAARNLSFSRATGDWLLWADCDDLLVHPEAVRAAADTTAADCVRYPYDVRAAGKLNVRERLVRRRSFEAGCRWGGRVHEVLTMPENWEYSAAATWLHDPVGAKAGGRKRNLRLLTAELERAPEHYFYVHQEYVYLGHTQNAQRFGELALGLPGLADTLKYQVLLNLAEITAEKEKVRAYAMRAWYIFPQHREALASLVRCAFQDDLPEQALYFAKIMAALPVPPDARRQWWHEPRWYGWAGDDLLERAQRLNGQHVGVRVEKRISLVHATRGRVNKAIAARDLWLQMADTPEAVEHIFAIDADDEEGGKWLRQFNHVRGSSSCVTAWNLGATAASAPILVQLSDDWIPSRGWDTAILREIPDPSLPVVLAVSDGGRNDDLLCMAICTRARVAQQGGELFSPEYVSMYSDNEFSHRAWRDGVVVDARDRITFEHAHPAFGKGEEDETYRRQNAPERYTAGFDTFVRRNPGA
jgi:glycosyltransferase involved in cell wall biosynthesis